MLNIHAANFRELWRKVNDALFHNQTLTPEGLAPCHDYAQGARHASYHNIFTLESAECDLDIGQDSGYVGFRFNRLMTDYLVPDQVQRWLEEIERDALKSWPSFGYSLPTVDNKGHRGGACFMGFIFKFIGDTPHLTFISRMLGAQRVMVLDCCLLHILCKEIGERIGFDPSDFRIQWYADSVGISATFFPVFLAQHGMWDVFEEVQEEDWPEHWPIFRYWRERYVNDLSTTKFKRLRRHHEMWQRVLDNDRRSTPIEELSLAPLFDEKRQRRRLRSKQKKEAANANL